MLVPSICVRALGFPSPPLFGLVLLWLLLAWSVPYEGYHEVRSLTGPFAGDSDIKLAGPRTPAEVAADWVARAETRQGGNPHSSSPHRAGGSGRRTGRRWC